LTFESESQLNRIEANAFEGCSSLLSIQIPPYIQELSKQWAGGSSLREVIFESAFSLRKMIETSKVQLPASVEIKFVNRDCSLDCYEDYARRAGH
jgi:hypothetical protein